MSKTQTILSNAAFYGDLETVTKILATNPQALEILLLSGHLNPLHYTIAGGHVEIVTTLLNWFHDKNLIREKFIFLKSQDNPGKTTPLMMIPPFGREDCIKILLDHGADLHAKDINGWTALHHYARIGQLKIVEMLILQGAQINELTMDGQTPLILSCSFKSFMQKETVQFLLQNGADISMKDGQGASALDYAKSESCHEIVALLCDADSTNLEIAKNQALYLKQEIHGQTITVELSNDINEVIMEDGFTRLHCAANEGFVQITKQLIAFGASLNCQDKQGNTPLHYAIEKNNNDIAKMLLEAGANHSIKNQEGLCALHNSAIKNDVEMVKILIKYGAYVDELTDDSETPLMLAALHNAENAVQVLLDNHANVNLRDEFNGWTALHHAICSKDINIIDLLLKHGADVDEKDDNGISVLHHAILENDENIVLLLFSYGVDIHTKDNNNTSALHVACHEGYENMVKLLINHDADLHGKTSDGLTPLIDASFNNKHEVAELLLQYGALVNDVDYDGWTALHYAAQAGRIAIAQLLISHEADIDMMTFKSGSTPLMIATRMNNKEMVQLLINNFADPFIEDRANNMSAIEYAKGMEYYDIEQLLLFYMQQLDAMNEEEILH
jgi:ankyrin repeat protein